MGFDYGYFSCCVYFNTNVYFPLFNEPRDKNDTIFIVFLEITYSNAQIFVPGVFHHLRASVNLIFSGAALLKTSANLANLPRFSFHALCFDTARQFAPNRSAHNTAMMRKPPPSSHCPPPDLNDKNKPTN